MLTLCTYFRWPYPIKWIDDTAYAFWVCFKLENVHPTPTYVAHRESGDIRIKQPNWDEKKLAFGHSVAHHRPRFYTVSFPLAQTHWQEGITIFADISDLASLIYSLLGFTEE